MSILKQSDFNEQLGIHSHKLNNIFKELEAVNHLSNKLSFISRQRQDFPSQKDKAIHYDIMYTTKVLNLALTTATNNLEERLNEIKNLRKELTKK